MSPSNSAGFPGMEHTRTGGAPIIPKSMQPTPIQAGPNRQDRETALKFAVELIGHDDFRQPIAATVEAAKKFAAFLHDGTVKSDGETDQA